MPLTLHKSVGISETEGKKLFFSVSQGETFDNDTAVRYTEYGFVVSNADGDELLRIDKIHTDISFVEEFIDTCINGKISLLHIRDVLEDTLC